jgi:S-adenosylmethionine decarboxylase
VDIYTCKAFDPEVAVAFTADFLAARAVVAKSF